MESLHFAQNPFAGAATRDELTKALRHALAPSRITAFAIGFLPDHAVSAETTIAGGPPSVGEPFLLLDWPRQWLELYASRGFAADDVVVAEAARTSEPFTWREVQRRHPGSSAHIFAVAAEFGWPDGFVVPVHDPFAAPGQRFGVVSLAASALCDFDQATRRTVAALGLAAFARALALRSATTQRSQPTKLTRREREALALVADGCNDMEIGARLGIAAATAHFHVERGKSRLGAATRAQAVAIAIVQELL